MCNNCVTVKEKYKMITIILFSAKLQNMFCLSLSTRKKVCITNTSYSKVVSSPLKGADHFKGNMMPPSCDSDTSAFKKTNCTLSYFGFQLADELAAQVRSCHTQRHILDHAIITLTLTICLTSDITPTSKCTQGRVCQALKC